MSSAHQRIYNRSSPMKPCGKTMKSCQAVGRLRECLKSNQTIWHVDGLGFYFELEFFFKHTHKYFFSEAVGVIFFYLKINIVEYCKYFLSGYEIEFANFPIGLQVNYPNFRLRIRSHDISHRIWDKSSLFTCWKKTLKCAVNLLKMT